MYGEYKSSKRERERKKERESVRGIGGGACSTRCARSYLKIVRTERMIYDTFDNDPRAVSKRAVGLDVRGKEGAEERVKECCRK